jgi:hypothetical protein
MNIAYAEGYNFPFFKSIYYLSVGIIFSRLFDILLD